MIEGTIARLSPRGFGFLETMEHGDVFFYAGGLVKVRFNDLEVGDTVHCTVEEDANGRGLRATSVTVPARTVEAPRVTRETPTAHDEASVYDWDQESA